MKREHWTVGFGDPHCRTTADVVRVAAEPGTSIDRIVARAAEASGRPGDGRGRVSTITREDDVIEVDAS